MPYRILTPLASALPPRASCALAIMAKAPQAGAVKTRLVPPLTENDAAALSGCFLRDTAENVAAVIGAEPVLVFAPAGAEAAFDGLLPDEFALLPQRGAALDERLIHAVEDLRTLGYRSVCLLGADSPTFPAELLAAAVAALARPGHRAVIAPVRDGGYHLIGLNRPDRRLFRGIDWSTGQVFTQTLARAAEARLEVELLPGWYDVDDEETLRQLCRELFAGDGGTASKGLEHYPAPHTRKQIARLLADGRLSYSWPEVTG